MQGFGFRAYFGFRVSGLGNPRIYHIQYPYSGNLNQVLSQQPRRLLAAHAADDLHAASYWQLAGMKGRILNPTPSGSS